MAPLSGWSPTRSTPSTRKLPLQRELSSSLLFIAHVHFFSRVESDDDDDDDDWLGFEEGHDDGHPEEGEEGQPAQPLVGTIGYRLASSLQLIMMTAVF